MDFIEKNRGVVIVCAVLVFILALLWNMKISEYYDRHRINPAVPTGP